MIEQTFTFGFDHRNPRTGESLGKRYVTLTGATKNACRAEMLSRFGREWSHQYDSPEAAGATKYGLTELTTGELPGESGKFTVDDNDEIVVNE